MSELRELYQQVIIDHGRHPRNFGALASATHYKQGFNPLCGDKIALYLQEHNGVVEKIQFDGCGCAISIASASLMTEALQGKTYTDIRVIFQDFHEWIMDGKSSDMLGKLVILGGVREFPARVKCATLAWHTLKAILENSNDTVTTEE